jgi:hypothetical protein
MTTSECFALLAGGGGGGAAALVPVLVVVLMLTSVIVKPILASWRPLSIHCIFVFLAFHARCAAVLLSS